MPEWKDTCNLPRTAFSMKANLQTAEPEAIARWEQMDLYGQLRRARSGAPKFVLHDGPPYANGEIHIGTALNKVLKDFVVKSRSMAGFDAPYVPGWDCHGLPIELKVDRQLGPKKRQMSVADFRRECRAYAAKYVGIMREDFKRLGVFGTWDEPYLTMDPGYQAAIVRALGRFVEQGMVYKGKKPVHWCMHCRTALAEAEVEYEPHTSPSIYVEFPLVGTECAGTGATCARAGGTHGLGAHLDDDAVDDPVESGGRLSPGLRVRRLSGGRDRARSSSSPRIWPQTVAAKTGTIIRRTARDLRRPRAGAAGVHASAVRPRLARRARRLRHARGGHRRRAHRARSRRGRLHTGVKYGLEIYGPLDAGGHFLETVELFGGMQVLDANPKIEAALAERGRLWHREDYDHSYPHCWRCHNPVIFLATSQWFIAMDTWRAAAAALCRRSTRRAGFPPGAASASTT